MIREETVAENAWRIDEGLYRILLPMRSVVPFVSVYLVESRGHRMLVDCGLNSETSLRALGRALKAIGVPPHGLDMLLLTHRHPDHAEAAGPVHRRWGGRVLLHPGDMGHYYPTADEAARWARSHGVPEAVIARLDEARPVSRETDAPLEPIDPDQPLEVGDRRFEVIPVPGHAHGHVMLHEKARGWLLAADQVVAPGAPNVWYNPGTEGDPLGDYLGSLRRTREIAADLILPSHGGPRRGGLREAMDRQLAFQERYLERVLRSVGAEPASTWEITLRIDPEPGDPFVLAEVLAALVHLGGTGAIERLGEGNWRRPRTGQSKEEMMDGSQGAAAR